MRRRLLSLSILLAGCGGAWDAAKPVTDIVNAAHTALDLCSPDAGACTASQIRALEQLQMCLGASLLSAHNAPVPDDAGASCQP